MPTRVLLTVHEESIFKTLTDEEKSAVAEQLLAQAREEIADLLGIASPTVDGAPRTPRPTRKSCPIPPPAPPHDTVDARPRTGPALPTPPRVEAARPTAPTPPRTDVARPLPGRTLPTLAPPPRKAASAATAAPVRKLPPLPRV
jgi:hypothetical protein